MNQLYFRSFEESRLHICHRCEKPQWCWLTHFTDLGLFYMTDYRYCMACMAWWTEACLHDELQDAMVRRGGTIQSDPRALPLKEKLAMVLFGGSLSIRPPSLPDSVSQLIIDCVVGDPNPASIGNRRSRHRRCLYVLLANGNDDFAKLAFSLHRPSWRGLLERIIAFAV